MTTIKNKQTDAPYFNGKRVIIGVTTDASDAIQEYIAKKAQNGNKKISIQQAASELILLGKGCQKPC